VGSGVGGRRRRILLTLVKILEENLHALVSVGIEDLKEGRRSNGREELQLIDDEEYSREEKGRQVSDKQTQYRYFTLGGKQGSSQGKKSRYSWKEAVAGANSSRN